MSFQDATQMAEAVRSKQVSPAELIQHTMKRVEQINPLLNAITSTRFEQALHEATTRSFTNEPFAGVPIFLKDLGQQREGDPDTLGSKLFQQARATHTDYYVQRLEAMGFIIVGRSSVPEFGFKNISDSQLFGPVNLPDDVRRNAGGSSGGAAALVTSGISPLAPASDGGGSIRIPASFNGLIGLKPTRGRIPVGPRSYRGWQGASVQFALTQSVRDTRTLLKHFQVKQMESPFIVPRLSQQALSQPINRPLKVAVCTQSPVGGVVSDEAIQAVQIAARFLERQGHDVIVLDTPIIDGISAMQSYYLMNSVETAAMFDGIEKMYQRPLTIQDMELMTWAIYQSGQHIPAKRYTQVLATWDEYSRQMAEFHTQYDLLLTPTTADVAPLHGQLDVPLAIQEQLRQMDKLSVDNQQALIWQMFAKSLDLTPFTQQANLTGQPAISLPTHRTADGLALGVQFIAAKGREDLLLAVADLFEQHQQFK
ncbi:amidase [Atopobacter phocae]|uniref:amidase n=1 Tax=Atopobacter phocae TaxID=136492 RepID=UPI0004701F6E|nr:amidase [Atopobacter phocae]